MPVPQSVGSSPAYHDLVDTLNVRPGIGIGPIEIGMSRSAAIAAASAAGLTVKDFRRGSGPGKPDLVINGQLFAYFDGDGMVEEVEVAVPTVVRELGVTCLGLDLTASYEVVRDRMSAIARVDETDPDYPGTSVYFDLGLSLWADAKAEDLPKCAWRPSS
jgi:hypothetical protein